jgi:hypothetical protein
MDPYAPGEPDMPAIQEPRVRFGGSGNPGSLSSEIEPDKYARLPGGIVVAHRIITEYERAEALCKEWQKQLQGIQDLLIVGPEDTGKWLVAQRHRYRGIQKGALSYLQYLSSEVSEEQKQHLAAMLKLSPAGKITESGKVKLY